MTADPKSMNAQTEKIRVLIADDHIFVLLPKYPQL
jgi:hypothetical protein